MLEGTYTNVVEYWALKSFGGCHTEVWVELEQAFKKLDEFGIHAREHLVELVALDLVVTLVGDVLFGHRVCDEACVQIIR